MHVALRVPAVLAPRIIATAITASTSNILRNATAKVQVTIATVPINSRRAVAQRSNRLEDLIDSSQDAVEYSASFICDEQSVSAPHDVVLLHSSLGQPLRDIVSCNTMKIQETSMHVTLARARRSCTCYSRMKVTFGRLCIRSAWVTES